MTSLEAKQININQKVRNGALKYPSKITQSAVKYKRYTSMYLKNADGADCCSVVKKDHNNQSAE